MAPDRTATETAFEARNAKGPAPALIVAWHPDPRLIGSRRRLVGRERVVLGRGSEVLGPGVLDASKISGEHCAISVSGARVRIEDLGSRNGTRVDGVRIESVEVDTAILQVGPVVFSIEPILADWATSDGPLLRSTSPAMGPLLEQIGLVGPLDSTVLVQGETGTGKERVARAIHAASGRTGPFVAVNCGAVEANLLASELFGHVRGAFTGADRARVGLIEEASRGTLLLDEIGDAPASLQTALLRVLQEHEVRPVGGNRAVPVQTRFVAATHRDLADAVEAGSFREDLYARLARWELMIPPLRERRTDIVALAIAAAERHAGRPVRLHHRLAHHLLLRDWPRNVRELEAAVEQAVVLARGADPIPLPEAWPEVPDAPAVEAGAAPADRPDRETLEARLLEGGMNLRKVADELGIGRSTLYRWIRQLGIDVEELRGSR